MKRILPILFTLLACTRKVPDREYRTFDALADGTAIITWRDRPGGPGMGRIDANGDLLWSIALPGAPQQTWDRAALLIVDGVIAIRTYRINGRQSAILLAGISMREGKRLWVRTLRERESFSESKFEGFDRSYWGHGARDRFVVYMSQGRRDAATIHEIDVRTGDELARAHLKPGNASHWVATLGDSTIIHDPLTDHDLVVRGSDTRHLEAHGIGCVVDGDYWRLVKTSNGWSLTSLAEPTRSISLETQATHLTIQGCSRYRGSWLLVANTGERSELWVVDGDGRVRARQDVGIRLVTPLTAPSTRFLPLLLYHGVRGHELVRGVVHELVMFDLEHHAVAWRLEVGVLDEIFRIGDRWFWISLDGRRLVQLDGADGRIVHAVRFEETWTAPFRTSRVVGDVMKLFRGTRHGVQTIAVDMKTLRASGEHVLTDARNDADLAVLPHKTP